MRHSTISLFWISITLLFTTACSDKNSAQQTGARVTEVGIVTIKAQNLELNVELPGRINAYQIAEIRPQVNGIILKRLFEEGSIVKEGQQLYQIDPALYEATYNTTVAQLQRSEAALKSASSLNKRYKELIGIEGVSKQEYVDSVSALAQAHADVAIAKAAKDTAQINLNYTKVFSPITGRIGKSNVTPGALVTANQAVSLAVVQQLDPIYADLTQSSTDILKLRQKVTERKVQNSNEETVVRIVMDGINQLYDKSGVLKFSDVTVEQSTGNISIRAVIPNPEYVLLPGLFVRAIINEGQIKDALLVPQQAVTRDKNGKAVAWIVDDQNKAQLIAVETGEAIGDKWLVTKGLTSGQKVIVEGSIKIKPGDAVKTVDITKKTVGQEPKSSTPALNKEEVGMTSRYQKLYVTSVNSNIKNG